MRAIIAMLFALSIPCIMAATVSDFGGFHHMEVDRVVSVTSEDDIAAAIRQAKEQHLSISISGKRHSQGGQVMFPHSLHLNMLTFNNILQYQPNKKLITVEPGVTWQQIQKKISPDHLAVRVMQSSNIFTVGGSVSVNAHGRDPREGPVISTIDSMHVMMADGKIWRLSRTHHPLLFSLVCGGYGLFGVITDVTLRLADNTLLQAHYSQMPMSQLVSYFYKHIHHNKNVGLFFARTSSVPGRYMFDDVYVMQYDVTKPPSDQYPVDSLKQHDPWYLYSLFNLSRYTTVGKWILWHMEKWYYKHSQSEKLFTRNNLMHPPITFLTNYHSRSRGDILQEYFVPIHEFVGFMHDLKTIALTQHINLLNVTIRYEPRSTESYLYYCSEDSFAVVLYMNVQKKPAAFSKVGRWTRLIIQAALRHHGSYYLPYQLWATHDELRAAYPQVNQFFSYKRQYDPDHLWMNMFYSRYATPL